MDLDIHFNINQYQFTWNHGFRYQQMHATKGAFLATQLVRWIEERNGKGTSCLLLNWLCSWKACLIQLWDMENEINQFSKFAIRPLYMQGKGDICERQHFLDNLLESKHQMPLESRSVHGLIPNIVFIFLAFDWIGLELLWKKICWIYDIRVDTKHLIIININYMLSIMGVYNFS